MEQGLIQVYTGDGKGKTTAAFGLAIRAVGRGLKVVIVQFLKQEISGEVLFVQQRCPEIEFRRFNSQEKFVWNMNAEELQLLKDESRQGFEFVKDVVRQNKCDILILDELVHLINKEIITMNEVRQLASIKPFTMELVLTGRNASPELIELADLVTEMKPHKHPYEQGIQARVGIES
jgi:ATP:corrinoid adenosyltransferase